MNAREEVIKGKPIQPYTKESNEGGMTVSCTIKIKQETRSTVFEDALEKIVEVTQYIEETNVGVAWHDYQCSVGGGSTDERTNIYTMRIKKEK